jgi:hypothetical protein
MADRPRIDSQLVCEFVGHAHSDLDRIKAMLGEQPALVNAAWDWGAGDWETGLGAAAHMGRRDIAQFLLAHGARMDIFSAAMLGHLAVVQAMLIVNPEARNSLGPHGIPLVKHAEAGGERAAAVADYLKGPGAGR